MNSCESSLAGYGDADITPSLPCDLNGFAARKQPCLGVAAPVRVRVLLLRAGRTSALVAVCDLLGFTPADSADLEAALATAAAVPRRQVMLSCTHTHSGPMSMPLGLVGRFQRSYLKQVRAGLVRAARAAVADLAPVKEARFGTASIRGLAQFRCAQEDPGRGIGSWPGRLAVLQIERTTTPITIVHAGIHPYVLGWKRRVMHPDFPGPLCDVLAKRTNGDALFLPGCGADVQGEGALSTRLADVTRFGKHLAAAAETALRQSKSIALAPLSGLRLSPIVEFSHVPPTERPRTGETAMRKLTAAEGKFAENHRRWLADRSVGRLRQKGRFPMQLLHIGDLLFVGLAAELFYDTGTDLCRALRCGDHTLVLSHTGGNVGYLPRPFSYRHRTYESSNAHEWYGRSGALARGTEARLRRILARASKVFPAG
jgi:neutral ceramidase